MPKLKIFLMTRNEPELIEDWITYHAHLFGMANVHILDGSDDEYVLSVYEKYRPQGLNIHFSHSGLDDLAQELTALMQAYKGNGNFLIKLDTDEFLTYSRPAYFKPRTAFIRTIRARFRKKIDGKGKLRKDEFLAPPFDYYTKNTPLSADDFEKFFSELPVTGQRYKASFVVWSHPKEAYCSRPCCDIETFFAPQFTHLKSFFHSDSFVSVDLGGHTGVSTQNKGFIDTGLTVIHYHNTSVDDTMRRAQQVLISHKYIDAADTAEQEHEKLSALEHKRMSSSHKIDLYLSYLRANKAGKKLPVDTLNAQHPYFRSGKSQKMTLVKDILKSIGR